MRRGLRSLIGVIVWLAIGLSWGAPGLRAQSADSAGELSKPQVEALVAPIALYPDALLAQVLMASTYPLEIVQAARWAKANPKVTGKALEDAMQKQPWDASVKSLTAVPQVLAMMNEKLDWTQQLGDAFLAQREAVMMAVQELRARAKAAGTLTSSPQQTVTTTTSGSTTYIVIEQANPQVVYVPVYNPTVVYGAWAYPAYPPVYWYPPGYVASNLLWFGVGVAVGSAIWGGCNWGHYDVDIDINHYNQFNRTTINQNNWRHDPVHRRAVPYGNPAVAGRYGKGPMPNAPQREVYRGRVEPNRTGVQPAGSGPIPRVAGAAPGRPIGAYDGIGNGSQVRQNSARGGRSLDASKSGRSGQQRFDR
jgi:hypothetical protein